MAFPHWYYFVTLVDDLERSSRYVEFSPDNFKCFSIEFARILLAANSEIDVVAKLLCQRIDSKATAENMVHYHKIITSKYPSLPQIEISMPRFELDFTPWESWSREGRPPWWKSYNNVKHHRDKYFAEANLENALRAVGALCVLVCYLYPSQLPSHKLSPLPKFLFLGTQYAFGNALIGEPCYHLPDCTKPEGQWVQKGKNNSELQFNKQTFLIAKSVENLMKYTSILIALALVGCASPKVMNVRIESDPSGAHVFYGVGANEDFAASGRSFIGTTPFTWTYEAKPDGTFELPGALVYSTFVPPVAVFTAEPPSDATNLFVKRQVFHGGTVVTAADKVPQGIFFDLKRR